MNAPANMQFTVKQAAMLLNVSERMIYMARKVMALRPDLEAEMMAGTMSMNRAYGIATGRPKAKVKRRCPHCGGEL